MKGAVWRCDQIKGSTRKQRRLVLMPNDGEDISLNPSVGGGISCLTSARLRLYLL